MKKTGQNLSQECISDKAQLSKYSIITDSLGFAQFFIRSTNQRYGYMLLGQTVQNLGSTQSNPTDNLEKYFISANQLNLDRTRLDSDKFEIVSNRKNWLGFKSRVYK